VKKALVDAAGHFASRLAAQDRATPGYAAKFRKLSRRMRKAGGGDQTVPHVRPDQLIDVLLERGTLLRPVAVVMKRGQPSNCHVNAATLFRAGKGLLATGYCLDTDGLWRQHSWIVDLKGRVIETTERRVAYWGIVFDANGSELLAGVILRPLVDKAC